MHTIAFFNLVLRMPLRKMVTPTVSGIELMLWTKSSFVTKVHSFTAHSSAAVDLELYFLGDNICYHVS